jgi:steroid delta-isomerase-like uncharacterized protein
VAVVARIERRVTLDEVGPDLGEMGPAVVLGALDRRGSVLGDLLQELRRQTGRRVVRVDEDGEPRGIGRGHHVIVSSVASQEGAMTTAALEGFLDAFNAHDVDAIMSFFSEDCVFDTPRGQRYVGKEEVRRGIQARFDGIPDIVYGDERHFTAGDRGVSEWTIRGTQVTGEPIEVRGCDLFEFSGGKISRKDSYWKILD